MRIRSLKPEFWRDRDTTGRWPADMKLLYAGLWNVADDEGRFELDLDLLCADLDPFRVTWPDMGAVLAKIEATGCLVVYESGGRKYGFIPKFRDHQHPSKPTPSRLPAPPGWLLHDSESTPGALLAGEERRGEEGRGSAEVDEPPSAPELASPVVVTLPVVGGGAPEHPVTEADLEPLAAAYPGVDLRAEVLKARAWLIANPAKRKTPRGVPRFLNGWLERAQNGARRGPSPPRRPEDRPAPPLPLL